MSGAVATVPTVLADDDHVAVIAKPAGVVVFSDRRCQAQSVESWARSWLSKSRLADALAQPAVISPLRHAGVRGPVVIAKTQRAQALLRMLSDTVCVYTAVLTSEDTEEDKPDLEVAVEVLKSVKAATFVVLSLATLTTTADVDTERLCRSLPVLGARTKVPGGMHLALTTLALPSTLAELRGTEAQSVFVEPVPNKFEKSMRREALHAQRRQDAHTATGEGALVSFCQLVFSVPYGQLQPRPSSECLVHAAVRAASALPTSSSPLILDLGCGCGALMLSVLHALLPSHPSAAAFGIDIDAAALDAARANARAILGAADERSVHLLAADFGELHHVSVRERLPSDGVDVIVCNPPYLRDAAASGRSTSEHGAALYAGADGLDAYRAIAASLARAQRVLRRDGVLVLQLPASSRALRTVQATFERGGFRVKGSVTDRGIPRGLILQWDSAGTHK